MTLHANIQGLDRLCLSQTFHTRRAHFVYKSAVLQATQIFRHTGGVTEMEPELKSENLYPYVFHWAVSN